MMYRNQCTPRENLLNRINEVSFAVNDILLYLDTHPKLKVVFIRNVIKNDSNL